MLKFIHAADFHLDSAFAALPPEKAAERRREQRELPGRLAEAAREDHRLQIQLRLAAALGAFFDQHRAAGKQRRDPALRRLGHAGVILERDLGPQAGQVPDLDRALIGPQHADAGRHGAIEQGRELFKIN